MSAHIEVQFAWRSSELPSETEVVAWATQALHGRDGEPELTVRIVDEVEGAHLNQTYRRARGPTNVLSFPFEPAPGVDAPLLGDLAICAPVMLREAREQGKSIRAHCAHMVVHGTLHLLGYDHQDEEDARRMESEEIAILSRLGFADPYAVTAS